MILWDKLQRDSDQMTAKVRVGGLRGYNELVTQLGGDPLRLTSSLSDLPKLCRNEIIMATLVAIGT